MDLAALRIFKTVAETGGITKAAARLHRVQSNVTTRVKQLEESLGTPLFHRHKRRLTLSDRKSTRLNSSHSQISYAVFCLKKKKKKQTTIEARKRESFMQTD